MPNLKTILENCTTIYGSSVPYPTNALCSSLSNIGNGLADGNIFIHPFFISKILDHIDENDFSHDNIFLKKEIFLGSFDSSLNHAHVEDSSIFKNFAHSSETQMKYTFVICHAPRRAVYPDDRLPVSMAVSPFSDNIEVISKHAHIVLKTPYMTKWVMSAGEILLTRQEGSVNIVINLSSGTFHDHLEEYDSNDVMVSPLNAILKLTTKTISLAARNQGLDVRATDIRVELGEIPSAKFEHYVPRKPSYITNIANVVDKKITWTDISSYVTTHLGVTENATPFLYKQNQYRELSIHDQSKVRALQSLSRNVIESVLRPRVYASTVSCPSMVGLLITCERILGIIGGKAKYINTFSLLLYLKSLRADLMHKLYTELLRFSVDFGSIRDSLEISAVPLPSKLFLSKTITKHSFSDYSGLILLNDIYPFKRIEVGKRLGDGNFGVVHEVDSHELFDTSPPVDFPLVIKIVTDDPLKVYEGESLIHYFNMVHQAGKKEDTKHMNAFSDTMQSGIFFLTVMERMHEPNFEGNIDAIFMDILRDILRLDSLRLVHLDIKPDNIMRKSNGVHILVDYGLVLRKGSTFNDDGTMAYSSTGLNILHIKGWRESARAVTSMMDVFAILVTYIEHTLPLAFQKYSSINNFENTREHKLGLLNEFLDSNHSNNFANEMVRRFMMTERELEGETVDYKPVRDLMNWITLNVQV